MQTGDIDWDQLFAAAMAARGHAHAPYSQFPVGAAVLTADGRVFAGCNVENRSFGLTLCAERGAVAAAVAAGAVSVTRPARAVLVVTATSPPAGPCGICREALQELGGGDLPVVCANLEGERQLLALRDLLPQPFVFPPPSG